MIEVALQEREFEQFGIAAYIFLATEVKNLSRWSKKVGDHFGKIAARIEKFKDLPMTDEVKPDPKQATTQEAQLAAENMASGVEETPAVDFDADYEAAQQFSVSDVDHTGEGAAAAEAATTPDFQVSEPQETKTAAQATGNPSDYLDMAKDVAEDVGSQTEAGTGNVDDDLIKKALDMGKPGSST